MWHFSTGRPMTKKNPKPHRNPSPKSSARRRRVMGLDLSVRGTGMVVWNGKKALAAKHLRTEGVKTEGQVTGLLPSGMFRGNPEERIEWLSRRVVKCYRRLLPDLVVIEEYAFSRHSRGLSILHECGGVVKNKLFRMEAPLVIVQNTTSKLYLAGRGRASKEEMIAAAQIYWPECPDNDDIADAFGLAKWGWDKYSELVA